MEYDGDDLTVHQDFSGRTKNGVTRDREGKLILSRWNEDVFANLNGWSVSGVTSHTDDRSYKGTANGMKAELLAAGIDNCTEAQMGQGSSMVLQEAMAADAPGEWSIAVRIPSLGGGRLRFAVHSSSGLEKSLLYDGQYYRIEQKVGTSWQPVSDYMRMPADGNEALNEHRWQVNVRQGNLLFSINAMPLGEVPGANSGTYEITLSHEGGISGADIRFDDAVGSYLPRNTTSSYEAGPFDMTGKIPKFLSWVSYEGKGARLRFQLRNAGGSWKGPGGALDQYFETSGQDVSNIGFSADDEIYYRVVFESDNGKKTPSLSQAELAWE